MSESLPIRLDDYTNIELLPYTLRHYYNVPIHRIQLNLMDAMSSIQRVSEYRRRRLVSSQNGVTDVRQSVQLRMVLNDQLRDLSST